MSIIAYKDSGVLVQGITGQYAQAQTLAMLHAGTRIKAGVTPGRGGIRVHDRPVYDSVSEAVNRHDVDTSLVYAPGAFVLDAVWEALDSGMRVVVVAAEGVPQRDAVLMRRLAEETSAWLIGPNTIGLISPGEILLGSFPAEFSMRGSVGIVARSGSLAIEVMHSLTRERIGQSTVIAVGGDPVIGRDLVDYVQELEEDHLTKIIVYLGEVGGLKEYGLADHIPTLSKPVVGYIAGMCAPPNQRMGHVGAIVYGHKDSAQAKRTILEDSGAHMVSTPWEVSRAVLSLQENPSPSKAESPEAGRGASSSTAESQT